MPPLVPPGGHKYNDHKRARRSPDRNAPVKRPRVDNLSPRRDVEQFGPAIACVARRTTTQTSNQANQAPGSKPSPAERRPQTEPSTDPRRRQSELSSDPRKRQPEPVQSQVTQPSTEPSSDPRPRKPSRPNVPAMVPLSSTQQGNTAAPVTPDAVSSSTAPVTSYVDPFVSSRPKRQQLQHHIAEAQARFSIVSAAREKARETHEDFALAGPKRGISTQMQQVQAKEALENLKRVEKELQKTQNELHQLLHEEDQLHEKQLTDVVDGLLRRNPQPARTTSPGAEKSDFKSQISQTVEAILNAKFTEHKAEISQMMNVMLNAKLTEHKAEVSQKMDSKFEAKLTGIKAIMKAEMGPIIDKKLADEKEGLKKEFGKELLPIMDKKLADEKSRRSKLFQNVDDRVKTLQDESWELQKSGLSISAVQKWSNSLEAHDTRIKALEDSPSHNLQDDLQMNEERIKALEGGFCKLKEDVSFNDLQSNLSSLQLRTKATEGSLQRLEEARSAEKPKADLEQFISSIKALKKGIKKLEEASAKSSLQSDIGQLKSEIKNLKEGFDKLEGASAAKDLQHDLKDLKAKTKALEERLEKSQTAESAKASSSDLQELKSSIETLDSEVKSLRKATSDNDPRSDIQVLKAQSQIHGKFIEKLQATSNNDLQSSLQNLEQRIEATEVANNARWPEDRMDSLHDLEKRVIELEDTCWDFRHDIEWTRRCIDHHSDDFERMPLYNAMRKLFVSSRPDGKSFHDNCTPRDIMAPDFKAYLDPSTEEYHETPLAGHLHGWFTTLEDKIKETASNLDNRIRDLEEKVEESEKVGDLWDECGKIWNQVLAQSEKLSHLESVPVQIKELGQKHAQLRLEFEARPQPARAQEEGHMAHDETLRCLESLPGQVEDLSQRYQQLKQKLEALPHNLGQLQPADRNNGDGALVPSLSDNAVREIASAEISKFKKEFKILEAQAKQDGQRLKDRIVGLEQAATDLKEQFVEGEQVVKDLKDLEIIKHGRRHIELLGNYFRDFEENQLPSITTKIAAMDMSLNQTIKLVPSLVERARHQETFLQSLLHQVGQLQLVVAAMAKRFAPPHHVPPEWEYMQASAEQGGLPRLMPAHPNSAVQANQYRQR